MIDKIVRDVNDALSEWNPLDLPREIAEDEYRCYVEQLIAAGTERLKIKSELVKIISDLGLMYDRNNPVQQNDLEHTTNLLWETLQTNRQ